MFNRMRQPIMAMPDNTIDIENTKGNIDIDITQAQSMNVNSGSNMGYVQGGCMQQPVVEPVQERVVHKTIMHEVPHICPIRTKVVNHHIYRHTYQPDYSCCEENQVENVQCGSCCNY